MNDRELLELAARALGFTGGNPDNPHCWTESEYPKRSGLNGALWNYKGHMDTAELWNPLTDDGDALRLSALLRFSIKYVVTGKGSVWVVDDRIEEVVNTDVFSSLRYAIVRAAAAIGEGME